MPGIKKLVTPKKVSKTKLGSRVKKLDPVVLYYPIYLRWGESPRTLAPEKTYKDALVSLVMTHLVMPASSRGSNFVIKSPDLDYGIKALQTSSIDWELAIKDCIKRRLITKDIAAAVKDLNTGVKFTEFVEDEIPTNKYARRTTRQRYPAG